MKFTIQKTTFWNRIAAALLDFITILIVMVGIGALISWACGYNDYHEDYVKEYIQIGQKYNLSEFAKYDLEEEIPADFQIEEVLNLSVANIERCETTMSTRRIHFGQKYNNVDLNVTPEQYKTLPESERPIYGGTDYESDYNKAKTELENDGAYIAAKDLFDRYTAADEEIRQNERINKCYSMMMSLSMLIISLGLFGGFLIVDFIVPLIFKNGQTLGKKIFSIALMHPDGIRVNSVYMFIRTILGKFTIETMVPLLMVIMIYFGMVGTAGLIVIAGIIILEIVLIIKTQNRSTIHDVLAKTVTVDIRSQQFFDNEEELIKFKEEIAEEEAKQGKYF